MPPERPWIDSCMAASCRPQLVGNKRLPCRPNNIETRASIPCQSQRSHEMQSNCLICTLPIANDDMGGRGCKTWSRLTPVLCMPPARIAWLPPPGNVEYGWSGHASVNRHLDSPHAAASLVYPPAICRPGIKEI